MKIMIASDIHGCVEKLAKALDFYYNEKIDKLIVLGDLEGYNNFKNEQVRGLLNGIDDIMLIKGNNDYIEDEDYKVHLIPSYQMTFGKYSLNLEHGDLRHYFERTKYNIYASGHTHRCELRKINDDFFINPGSIGLSRDHTGGTFIILSDKAITLYNLKYEVLDEMYL